MTYQRVLIKISGETFSNGASGVFDVRSIFSVAKNIKNVLDTGLDVSVVVGGGNILRGKSLDDKNVFRETADAVGMLATVINGLLLRDVLKSFDIDSVLASNINLPFGIISADKHSMSKLVKERKLIIFVAGAGLPYFSTDTASIIWAIFSQCDVVLKATKTAGLYDMDPKKHPEAKHIQKISYDSALAKNIGVLDQTAFALAKEQNIPILVFSMFEENCFFKAIHGEIQHSLVGD